jgi:hypothetical protein
LTPSIRISAVRTGEQRDWVYVERADGTEVSWTWSGDEPALPHDLVHWVVETEARLVHGFWGLVADGLDPARVNRMADRIASGVTLRDTSGRDLTDLIHAECLVTAVSGTEAVLDDAARARLRDSFERFGVDPPALSVSDLATMEGRIGDLRRSWFGTPEGSALELEFPHWETSDGGGGSDRPIT